MSYHFEATIPGHREIVREAEEGTDVDTIEWRWYYVIVCFESVEE